MDNIFLDKPDTPPPFSIQTIGNGRAQLMIFDDDRMESVPYCNKYGTNPKSDVLKMGRIADWYNDQFSKGHNLV